MNHIFPKQDHPFTSRITIRAGLKVYEVGVQVRKELDESGGELTDYTKRLTVDISSKCRDGRQCETGRTKGLCKYKDGNTRGNQLNGNTASQWPSG